MKIVNIAPNAPYNENWGYQENLLPKYQKKLGNDVTLITSCRMHQDGVIVETDEEDRMLEDGVRLIRKKQSHIITKSISNYLGYIKVYDLLEEIQPDLIFFHGLISWSINDVIKYKSNHKKCVVIQDNHMDYNIGFQTNSVKKKVLRLWYRLLNKHSVNYVEKVYGVTPWRKTYAADYFRIPDNKLDVLIMGADDEKINFAHREEIRCQLRKKYGVSEEDFLIVTGGKIDRKKGVDILADACKTIEGVKLMIFGQISKEMEDYFERLAEYKDKIIVIGWIDADKVYDYYFASDLVVFPGQHSVLWEQACAAKVPCIFAQWEGMNHVDVGGNSGFIYPVTTEKIREIIEGLLFTSKYFQMKSIAESSVTDVFLYSKIAEKSLECVCSQWQQ